MTNKLRYRITFVIAFIIGIIGALGQAYMLHHELVDCYPYKMMSFPPYTFYENIARFGVVTAPLIAIITGFLFGLKRIWLMTIVPVVLCPILFSVVYKFASILRAASEINDIGRNFGDTKPELIFQNFLFYSISLAVIGFYVGAICSLLIKRLVGIEKLQLR